MRKLILALVVLVATTTTVFAQGNSTQPSSGQSSTPGSQHKGYGYVFVAPGGIVSADGGTGTMHFGIGGEGLIKGGFGVGGEIGGLAPIRSFSSGIGVFSAGANYHFQNASKSGKVVPFVNGGYTLFFRDGVANGVHFGGGANYWFKERVGLRFEVRDHVAVEYPDAHYIGFRVGLTFR
ncbi:MAG: hypothetical protein ACKVZH_27735 [Blastocatellia bacterium]